MKPLRFEVIETHTEPDAAVIWLHGLGADGHDFVPIVPELRLPTSVRLRFIFPHAPHLPVTINGGMVMSAWYDIFELSIDRKIDTDQIMASAQAVKALVDAQIEAGIDSDRIILAGFSQGGAVAYQVALSYEQPLGGLMAMSTYFATEKTIDYHPANTKLPIHIFHGTQDNVVPQSLGAAAHSSLQNKGYTPSYKTYPMAHSVHPQQVKDISQWLQTVL
jgi:phospholipase/carboxylesterase